MGKVPMFIPGTISKSVEVNKGPFVPENVPINATPLPNTNKATGFPPVRPVIIKSGANVVVPVPEEDSALIAIQERRKKEERGDRS